jgi:cysteine desulfurase/selenocysteine lyase
LLPSVRPVAVGWKSTKHPLDFDHPSLDLREDAAKLEEGTPNSMGIYGLEAALELLLEAGIARIAGHVTEWLAALEKELPRAVTVFHAWYSPRGVSATGSPGRKGG